MMIVGCAPAAYGQVPSGSTAVAETAMEAVPEVTAGSEVPFEPRFDPKLAVRRAAGAIAVDGVLDDAGWVGAARSDAFTEYRPDNLGRPPVRTEVLVTYDDVAFYVAFIAYDDPAQVRAAVRPRDDMWEDDHIGVMIDTYGDGNWSLGLFANALGVQADVRYGLEEGGITFDVVYETAGRLTEQGYVVEMAVPFSSLRFPPAVEHVWRINFWRQWPRSSRRHFSWAAIDLGASCFQCHFGTVRGIQGLAAQRALSVLPAVVGSAVAERPAGASVRDRLDADPVRLEPSLGARYTLNSQFTAEVAVNPDFSQVEADPVQVDANAAFALSLPERRPFFQEGSDLFDDALDLVYTRSINAPLVAAKLTGRQGRTGIAYLSAWDEQTSVILPLQDRSLQVGAGHSVSNVLRLRRVVGQDSYLGLLLTDRRLGAGGSGSVLAGDGRYRFTPRLSVRWEAAASLTHEPATGALDGAPGGALPTGLDSLTFGNGHTAAFDGERFAGHALYGYFRRFGRPWTFVATYAERSPTFRAGNGFVTFNDQRQGRLTHTFEFVPQTALIDRIDATVDAIRTWTYGGDWRYDQLFGSLGTTLKGQTSVAVEATLERERYRGLRFDGIRRLGVRLESQPVEALSATVYVARGRTIARTQAVPVLGTGTEVQVQALLRPLPRLLIEGAYEYARLAHAGADLFDGYVLRLRAEYGFTRALRLRLVGQYDRFDDFVGIDPLLSYRPSPFTVVYLGSAHTFTRLDDGPRTGFAHTDRFVERKRHLFFKVQYLFNTR